MQVPNVGEDRSGDGAAPVNIRHVGLEDASARPGGLNSYLRDLVNAEREIGLQADAVVLDGPGARDLPGFRRVGDLRHNIVRRIRSMDRALGAQPTPDLLDCHFALYSVMQLRGRRRPPMVVHFQGPWADESVAEGGRRASSKVKRTIERTVYRRAARIIVLSRAFGDLVVDRYGVNPDVVRQIPPGVDLDRFSPGSQDESRRRLGLDPGTAYVVAVRRLRNRMGLETAIEAAAILASRRSVQLLIVGAGPEADRLKEFALRHQAPVRFIGRVDDDELADWYRASDVSVVPSVALEGFGLVVLESLATGTPVVASEVGGLVDALAGLNGSRLVPPGDADALAAALEATLDGSGPDPVACRTHAENFDWVTVAQRHQALYDEVLGRRRHVVIIGHTAQLSGGELALVRLLPALRQLVDVHVILAEDGPLVGRLTSLGASVEVLVMPEIARSAPRDEVRLGGGSVRSWFGTARYVRLLARRLRQLQPDVVHTNTLKAALYGAAAAKLAGVPTVTWHLRDRIADDYLPRDAVRLVRTSARFLPDGVIANSATTLATLSVPSVASAVVSSPLDPGITARSRVGEPVRRIGVIGRLAPWKGQHLFLEAFAPLATVHDLTAVVIGAPLFGEEAYAEELLALVDTLGIRDRVEFRGFKDDVGAELDELDVLVHSSLLPEPFGQVIIEGMAAGLPVIAANSGGPSEIIADGVSGLLYRTADRAALEAAMATVIGSGELRARLAEGGIEAAEHYRPKPLAEAMTEFWNQLRGTRG